MSDEREAHWQRLTPKTGVSQHLGADTTLELDCEGQMLQTRVDPRAVRRPHTPTDVFVNITRCRLSAHDTEQTL